jgi:apolipoprotein D and lipocalin family protein
VSGFDGERYLGKWYEIARLDHSFESDLSNVSAEYSKQEGGDIKVVNRGYNEKTGEWKQIEGKARFIDQETVGSLKVSFFGPFYGGYHVIALDRQDYGYAMVAGPSRAYLWILSRTKSMPGNVYSKLVDKAAQMGFDTANLIRVKHDRSVNRQNFGKKSTTPLIPANLLTPCPKTPNCVSSMTRDKTHFVKPFTYAGDSLDAQYEILGILYSMNRVRVVKFEDHYIHAEFVSSVFRFVDDVEFYFEEEAKIIQIKSASRVGYSDLGANRRRIEKIRKKYDEGTIG